MENLNKKCICIGKEHLEEIFRELFADYDEVDIEFDHEEGVYFCGISNQEVYKALSNYFEKNINYISLDNYERVWLCCD